MANDLADVPVSLLDAASREWARTKAFMPKSSELRNLAEVIAKARRLADENGGSLADQANARLAAQGRPPMWAMVGGSCTLVGPPIERSTGYDPRGRRSGPLSREEIDALPREIVSLGRAKGYLVAGEDGLIVDSQTAAGRGYFRQFREDEAA